MCPSDVRSGCLHADLSTHTHLTSKIVGREKGSESWDLVFGMVIVEYQ